MAWGYGPWVAGGWAGGVYYSNIGRIEFEYSISTTATHVTITLKAYLKMGSSWASNGTYAWNTGGGAGGWAGSGSAAHNLGLGGSRQFRSVTVSMARQEAVTSVNFTAWAEFYGGTTSPIARASHSINFTIAALDPAVPGKTVQSAVTGITDVRARANWTKPAENRSAITGYQIQLAKNSGFTTGLVTTTAGASATQATLSSLTARTNYWVRVRAQNGVGWGPWSDAQAFTTLGVPSTPSFSVTSRTATAIAGSLPNPSYTGGGITERQTQISASSGFGTVISTNTSASPNFTGLTRATTYYIRSRVKNSIGWSSWSSTVTTSTLAAVPSAPTGYGAVTDIASTSAYPSFPTVADNGGAALESMQVEITPSGGSAFTVSSFAGYSLPLLTPLSPGTTYSIRMRVRNSVGWSNWGGTATFTTKSNVPSAPVNLSASWLSSTHALLEWEAPANLHGATITSYTIRVASNASFSANLETYNVAYPGLARDLTNRLTSRTYYAQIWTNTSNGVGSASQVITFKSGSAPIEDDTMWMRVSGTWRRGVVWMRVSGTWRRGIIWQRISGTWRK